jgi:hypothetical protein
MEAANIINEIASLPPEAQKQIADFIAFIKTRYSVKQTNLKSKRISLKDEPFIGMWRDRKDMSDSSAWVRKLRKSEWERVA